MTTNASKISNFKDRPPPWKTIQSQEIKASWPPQSCEPTENAVTVADDLKEFFFTPLTGSTRFPGLQSCSEKVSRLINSFGQDLVFGASGGRQRPPKQVLLSYAVKSLAKNVELFQILHRCGHGIAYPQLEEINTSLCLQKLTSTSQNELPLPDNIRPFISTTPAWDNFQSQKHSSCAWSSSQRAVYGCCFEGGCVPYHSHILVSDWETFPGRWFTRCDDQVRGNFWWRICIWCSYI